MTSATASRQTPGRVPGIRYFTSDAAGFGYLGCMVQLNAAGLLVDASATAANITVGVAHFDFGASQGVSVDCSQVYPFVNSAGADAIAVTDIGKPAYVVDNQTVAKTSNSGARPVAGTIYDVNEYGVWIDFRRPL